MSLRSQLKSSRKLWWRNLWLLGSVLTEESRNFSVNDTKNTVFNQPDPSAGWFMLQWRIIWRKLVPGCCGAHPKIVTKDLINLASNGFIHYRRTRNRPVSRKDHGLYCRFQKCWRGARKQKIHNLYAKAPVSHILLKSPPIRVISSAAKSGKLRAGAGSFCELFWHCL